MASSDNLRAIVEASSAGRSALFYPAGVIPKEPDFLEYYMSEEADGRQTDFIGRQRSLSGATMDLIDMRNKMKRSITDLFDDFKIEDSADPLHFHRGFPLISHLFESMRVRRDGGPVLIKSWDWKGNVRTRILKRPTPVAKVDSETPMENLPEKCLQLWTVFMPVATCTYFELFSSVFGHGILSSVDLSEICTRILVQCAALRKGEFRTQYMKNAQVDVVKWLHDFKTDRWDYEFGTVATNGLSMILQKEGVNLGLQVSGSWVCHCREGATIVPYESCLWKGGSAEESVLLRPQSRTPQEHAKQAYEILSKLCGVPQGKKVTASDLVPDLSLFLGDACKRMINGAIHGVDLELFALAVEFMFHEEKDDMVRTESGIRGCKWMPLSVIAFAGSFLLMELLQVAGKEYAFGDSASCIAALYSLSTFESSVMDACVATLNRIYDSPESQEGKELHKFLKELESKWHLNTVFLNHRQELSLLDPSKFY